MSEKNLKAHRVLVVLVTYNGIECLSKCLASLKNSVVPIWTIVIDNNSNDGTTTYIKKNYPSVLLIENKENLGFGRANNIGLKYAIENKFEYVFLLNQDAWIKPDAIAKVIEFQKAQPGFGIISPVHLNGLCTELDKSFSKFVPYETLMEVKNSKFSFIETYFVNAAAWLISMECLLKVGGFDPLFIHYGEDRDYCYRATYHGFKIGVAMNAFISHERVYSPSNEFRKYDNTLWTVGLAHVKNVLNSLCYNYTSWSIIRSRKILKYIISMRIKLVYAELKTTARLFSNYKKIKLAREISKTTSAAFLSEG